MQKSFLGASDNIFLPERVICYWCGVFLRHMLQNFKTYSITTMYTLASIFNKLLIDYHSADFCRRFTVINGGLEKGILQRRYKFYHRIKLFIFVRFSGLLKTVALH